MRQFPLACVPAFLLTPNYYINISIYIYYTIACSPREEQLRLAQAKAEHEERRGAEEVEDGRVVSVCPTTWPCFQEDQLVAQEEAESYMKRLEERASELCSVWRQWHFRGSETLVV